MCGASGHFRARKPGMRATPPWQRAKETERKMTVAMLRDDRGTTSWSQCPRLLGSHRLRHRRPASPGRRPWSLRAQNGCGSKRDPPCSGQRSPTLPPHWPPATAHRGDERRRSYRLKTMTTRSASCPRVNRGRGEKWARRPGVRMMLPLQPVALAASLQSWTTHSSRSGQTIQVVRRHCLWTAAARACDHRHACHPPPPSTAPAVTPAGDRRVRPASCEGPATRTACGSSDGRC